MQNVTARREQHRKNLPYHLRTKKTKKISKYIDFIFLSIDFYRLYYPLKPPKNTCQQHPQISSEPSPKFPQISSKHTQQLFKFSSFLSGGGMFSNFLGSIFLNFGLWMPEFLILYLNIGFYKQFPPWGRVLRSQFWNLGPKSKK